MKTTLLTLAFAMLAFIPQVFAMDDAAEATQAAPITAVVFYSDSCGSCKILEPNMMKAMTAINTAKIDVVKFDFSNKDTITATKALAVEKGVDATLQQYGAKTGFVILLNDKGVEVGKLGVDDNAAAIAAKLTAAIIAAS